MGRREGSKHSNAGAHSLNLNRFNEWGNKFSVDRGFSGMELADLRVRGVKATGDASASRDDSHGAEFVREALLRGREYFCAKVDLLTGLQSGAFDAYSRGLEAAVLTRR